MAVVGVVLVLMEQKVGGGSESVAYGSRFWLFGYVVGQIGVAMSGYYIYIIDRYNYKYMI